MKIEVQTARYKVVRHKDRWSFQVNRLSEDGWYINLSQEKGSIYIMCVGSDGSREDLIRSMKRAWAPWFNDDFLSNYSVTTYK